MVNKQVLRIGIGGPVGSGKTALVLQLCKHLKKTYNIAVVTNDIYTKEDAQFLIQHEALEEDLIIGIEYTDQQVLNGVYDVQNTGATNCIVSGRGGVNPSWCGIGPDGHIGFMVSSVKS